MQNVKPVESTNIAAAITVAAARFTESMSDCRSFIIFVWWFVLTIAAPRYKQMTIPQKNGDVSVAIP